MQIKTIFMLIFFVVSVVVLVLGLLESKKDRTNEYAKTTATITDVTLQEKTRNTRRGNSSVIVVGGDKYYEVNVNYTYTVNDKNYFGSYVESTERNYGQASALGETIKAQKTFDVYYVIATPEKSQRNFSKNNSIPYFIGSALIFIFGLVIRFATFNSISSNSGPTIIFN